MGGPHECRELVGTLRKLLVFVNSNKVTKYVAKNGFNDMTGAVELALAFECIVSGEGDL